jgi:ribosomal protein S2
MKQLLESGVHFGHQTRRWNPKMKRFIFGERSGIYIIDLDQTLELLERAHTFVKNVSERGGTVMFVGTKKQTQDSVREQAIRAGMPYVSHRWLGGLLTNWSTISQRIRRLHELRAQASGGQLALLPTRERLAAEAELVKLEANLGGVAEMQRRPDAVVIVDLKKEMIGVREGLVEMASLVLSQVELAVDAWETLDAGLAERVMQQDEAIDDYLVDLDARISAPTLLLSANGSDARAASIEVSPGSLRIRSVAVADEKRRLLGACATGSAAAARVEHPAHRLGGEFRAVAVAAEVA